MDRGEDVAFFSRQDAGECLIPVTNPPPPRPSEARDREGPGRPVARGVATTSARRTPGRGDSPGGDHPHSYTDPRRERPRGDRVRAIHVRLRPTGGRRGPPRWRRCLARCNMNYGNAVVLAARSCARHRTKQPPHARWDAEREELHEARKAAVAQWRGAARGGAHEARGARRHDAREGGERQGEREERFNARRRRKGETRGVAREETIGGGGGVSGAARGGTRRVAARAEAARVKKKEREEREARNAARAQARWRRRRLREPRRRRRRRL